MWEMGHKDKPCDEANRGNLTQTLNQRHFAIYHPDIVNGVIERADGGVAGHHPA